MKKFSLLNPKALRSSYNNDNGCIALEDGTLICYGKTDKYVEVEQSAYYNDYRVIVQKPFEDFNTTVTVDNEQVQLVFINPPVVIVNQASNADYLYGNIVGVTRNVNRIENITFSRSREGTGWIAPHYIAIGRWK